MFRIVKYNNVQYLDKFSAIKGEQNTTNWFNLKEYSILSKQKCR